MLGVTRSCPPRAPAVRRLGVARTSASVTAGAYTAAVSGAHVGEGAAAPPPRRGGREGRHPPRGQGPRVPRGDHAGRRPRAGRARPPGLRRERAPGVGSSITDDEFAAAGATILPTADDVWAEASWCSRSRSRSPRSTTGCAQGQVLFTYLHLAASRECTEALLDARRRPAIAYETVELPDGALPLLAPMSEVAGRLAPQVGAYHLMRAQGGRGVLMGGVLRRARGQGRRPRRGRVGHERRRHRARHAGRGAAAGQERRQAARGRRGSTRATCRRSPPTRTRSSGPCSTPTWSSARCWCPGRRRPKLVTNELVARMKPGAVLVDISIDQGGCFEDSRPTTHADPTYQVHGCVFYCVANMPGAVPHTSTYALTNVTLPYALELADRGWRDALRERPALALGLNTVGGQVAYAPVAEAHGLPCVAAGARCSPDTGPPAWPVGRAPAGLASVRDLPRPPGGRARPGGQHAGRVPAGPAALPRAPGGAGIRLGACPRRTSRVPRRAARGRRGPPAAVGVVGRRGRWSRSAGCTGSPPGTGSCRR